MLKQAIIVTIPLSDSLSIDIELSCCLGDILSGSAIPLHDHNLKDTSHECLLVDDGFLGEAVDGGGVSGVADALEDDVIRRRFFSR